MKHFQFLLIALLCTTLMWSCSTPSESNDSQEKEPEEEVEDEINVNAIPTDPAHEWPQHTFGSTGLDFVKLGDTIMWRELNLGEVTVKDTVFVDSMMGSDGSKEEIAWNVRVANFEDGRVLLETDFDSGSYLNRVQIESPSYKHIHTGIHVGSTVKELRDAYGDLFVRPFPQYGVIEVLPDNHNIFHIKDTGVITEDPETWKFDLLPDDLEVVRIVVM